MDWQLIPVTVVVVAAIAYLCRELYQSWRGQKAGCAGRCQCPNKDNITWIATDQLTLRRSPRNRPR
jgi:hypothetical protein